MAIHRPSVNEYGFLWERSKKVCKLETCRREFVDRRVRGRTPKYCSDACKQKAYRLSKKADA